MLTHYLHATFVFVNSFSFHYPSKRFLEGIYPFAYLVVILKVIFKINVFQLLLQFIFYTGISHKDRNCLIHRLSIPLAYCL